MASPISLDKNLAMILQVRIYIAPEQVPEFFARFKPIYDIVLAEPECVFFVVGEDSQEPGYISWMEGWTKNQDWFMDVQFKKEYYKDYLAATEPMFIKPREISFLKPGAALNCFKSS